MYGHKAVMAMLRRTTTLLDWGFDPREEGVKVSKKLLWYGADDTISPPLHGKWLGEWYTMCAGARAEDDIKVRELDEGHGHLGAACLEWGRFLEELMGLVASAAPKSLTLTRC